jgi:hypothetical protein
MKESAKNAILSKFFATVFSFIFIEKRRTLLIKRKGRIKIAKSKIRDCVEFLLMFALKAITNEAIKKALAGVANPLKSNDCELSWLNLANLNAENIGIKNAR